MIQSVGQFLRRMVTEDAGIKLIAIVAALALFIIARGATVREVPIDIPVVISARPPNRVLLSEPPSNIKVRIRGNLKNLYDVLASRTPYSLDLSGYGDSQTAYLQVEAIEKHLGGGVKVTSISPSSFEIRLDRLETQMLPVDVTILKGPGHYWTVAREEMVIVPPHVEVSGPSSLLNKYRQIHTEPLDLSNITRDFTGKVALEMRDGLSSKPFSVQVTIPIREKDGEKLIRGARITVKNCPEGFVCEASPVFFEARIRGRERIVDMINRDNLERYVYIDAGRLSIEKGTLQKNFAAIEPVIDTLKEASIELPKVRFFNVMVTHR